MYYALVAAMAAITALQVCFGDLGGNIMMDLQDHLLIAMPNLEDSYFYRTVVYICRHNEKGSMGLVINQPTDLTIAELSAKMNFMMVANRTYNNRIGACRWAVTCVDRGFILHTPVPKVFNHSYKVNDNLVLTTSADVVDTFGTFEEPGEIFGCFRLCQLGS